jgi:hypothetical protein
VGYQSEKVEHYSPTHDPELLLELLGEDYQSHHNLSLPRGTIYQPVLEDFREDAEVVGFMVGSLTWDKTLYYVLFESSLPLLVDTSTQGPMK